MNKAELVESVRQRANLTQSESAAAVEALIDTIVHSVNKGESITIVGFGVFERRQRAARTARNIATGETVMVRAHKVPAFRPSAQFKAIVSGAQKLPRSGPAVGRGGLTVGRTSTATKSPTAAGTKKSSSAAAVKSSATPTKKMTAAAAKKPAPAKKVTAAPAAKRAAPAKRASAAAQKSTAKKAVPAKKTAAVSAKKAPAKKATGRRAPTRRSTPARS
jgi:DNA-binding protein HU-beta